MKRTGIRLALVAVAALLSASLHPGTAQANISAQSIEDLAYHWQGIPTWSGGHGPMRSVARMQSGVTDDAIHYESRRFGINLGFTAWRNSAVFVGGEGLSLNDPITPTTNVALYFTKGGYLKYQDREEGISLVWSSTPVYEWRIEPAGSTGNQLIKNISRGIGSFSYLAFKPIDDTVWLSFGPGPIRLGDTFGPGYCRATDLLYWHGLPTWSGGEGPMRISETDRIGFEAYAYGETPSGINIVRVPWRSSRVIVTGAGLPIGGSITPSTNAAIYFPGGGYLKHGVRENGIHLVWSTTPAYEWRIETHPCGQRLLNTVRGAYVFESNILGGPSINWYWGSGFEPWEG